MGIGVCSFPSKGSFAGHICWAIPYLFKEGVKGHRVYINRNKVFVLP